jgi:5'-nucleotidase
VSERTLVVNDDGVSSPGIRHLAEVAREVGLDVVVAAPMKESSGSSAALTASQVDGRIVVERRTLDGLDGVPVYGVDAAPAFIALIASRGAFGPPPTLLLSGINRGLNTGHAVLHSGTVGAAMTGRVNECRALAVSLDVGDEMHWETASVVARQAIEWVRELDAPLVLNVNVPNVPPEGLRGIRQGDLARFGAVQTTIAEVGEGFVRLGVADEQAHAEPGSDSALVAAGYASVTALRPLCDRHDDELTAMTALAGREPGRAGASVL